MEGFITYFIAIYATHFHFFTNGNQRENLCEASINFSPFSFRFVLMPSDNEALL
jgi:hypothetical protein